MLRKEVLFKSGYPAILIQNIVPYLTMIYVSELDSVCSLVLEILFCDANHFFPAYSLKKIKGGEAFFNDADFNRQHELVASYFCDTNNIIDTYLVLSS